MSLRDFFSGLGDALSNAFSGNEDREPASRGPSRTRPQQRPSIMTVQRTPEDERQRVATRDMPRFGITEGAYAPQILSMARSACKA
jgi:hypothetical protein